jgi:hypothetical protein
MSVVVASVSLDMVSPWGACKNCRFYRVERTLCEAIPGAPHGAPCRSIRARDVRMGNSDGIICNNGRLGGVWLWPKKPIRPGIQTF